ncbi:MAG: transposase [Bacteroidales bacterium]|nr:transposase [Bacteroidales bacterium]
MANGCQIRKQDETYFITLTVVNWIDVFTRRMYRDIVVENLRYCQKNKGLEIFAFVIMTNHIHLIVRCQNGNLSSVIRDFKSYIAKRVLETIAECAESRREWMLKMFAMSASRNKRNEKYQFWKQDNHPELLYSSRFIDEKVNYIHENPVKAGFVSNAEDYEYSSARWFAGKDCALEVSNL